MDYPVNAAGFEGQNIVVRTGFWAGPKLLVNGQPAPKGDKRGQYRLQRNDGAAVTASWKLQAFGLDVPQLDLDGQVVQLAEPLKWHQWAWGGWPITFVFFGGFLGGLLGFLAFMTNAAIFRSKMDPAIKYLLTLAVSFVAVILFVLLALLVSILLNG